MAADNPGAGDRPDIIVPWPKTEPREKKEYDCDTLRITVDEKTTRHDPEYVERKLEEDRQNEAKKKAIASMRTPLKELNRRERQIRKAKGKGKLTRGMLLRIGQVISRRRGAVMRQVGISIDAGTEVGEVEGTSPPEPTPTEPVPVAA
ncbi:hypothetical protein DID88_001942 [Monilinia fructigena]|uniref:Uncharacterized protein n=1 Tax=Monilinia fructigena TaxID=38457 RepID=A0A395IWV7_9HELO|nr:hypothetical protein DID88_001942 [Monilinia fructigena]